LFKQLLVVAFSLVDSTDIASELQQKSRVLFWFCFPIAYLNRGASLWLARPRAAGGAR